MRLAPPFCPGSDGFPVNGFVPCPDRDVGTERKLADRMTDRMRANTCPSSGVIATRIPGSCTLLPNSE